MPGKRVLFHAKQTLYHWAIPTNHKVLFHTGGEDSLSGESFAEVEVTITLRCLRVITDVAFFRCILFHVCVSWKTSVSIIKYRNRVKSP
jgi:hypothetical protein